MAPQRPTPMTIQKLGLNQLSLIKLGVIVIIAELGFIIGILLTALA